MIYPLLKQLHVGCVVLSLAGFVLRWFWFRRDPASRRRRWVRILPHLNDTVLLASAIAMAVLSGQYPFAAPWLTAKFAGLLAYIGLGFAAFRAPVPGQRAAAFAAAVAAFGWIVSVALTRDPRGVLGFLIA